MPSSSKGRIAERLSVEFETDMEIPVRSASSGVGESTGGASVATSKPNRPLACVQCSTRKIRCDRQFPCSGCVKTSTQCVPVAAPRQRRRRFAERELLDRLRKYETLLKQHNIEFDGMHKQPDERTAPEASNATTKKEHIEPVDFWRAVRQKSGDSDDETSSEEDEYLDNHNDGGAVRASVIKEMFDRSYMFNDEILLFGSYKSTVDLSVLHPPPAQILKFWQLYLDRVNPLLKVTHAPSMQMQIFEAIGKLSEMEVVMEALLFSIYCVVLETLKDEECLDMFASAKEELKPTFRLGCQQALLRCGVLCTNDYNCLAAFYLYLISVRSDADPRSLSSMLGAAIRIAQRMGMGHESRNTKCSPFVAEMRRRLWWALILYDNRICEMSDYKVATLPPSWDCRPPLNLNDFDLQPEMKTAPASSDRPADSIFACVRGELADFLRHRGTSLDLTNPSLRPDSLNDAKANVLDDGQIVAFANKLETKYFRFCSPDNPINVMSVWMTRVHVAKHRLFEHYSRTGVAAGPQTDAQRDAAVSFALGVLEGDTKLMNSPLTQGYHWLANMHFPFPAYIHLVTDLHKRPLEKHEARCWHAMSENWRARFLKSNRGDNTLFKIFSGNALAAWTACEDAHKAKGEAVPETPLIIEDMRKKREEIAIQESTNNTPSTNIAESALEMDFDDFWAPPDPVMAQSIPFDDAAHAQPGLGMPYGFDMSQQPVLDFDANQFDWDTMDPKAMHARGF